MCRNTQSKRRYASQRGFTLIELTIVFVLISILATIATPLYQDYLTRSRLTELELRIAALRTAAAATYATGDRSILSFTPAAPGVMPDDLNTALFSDSLTFPNIKMQLYPGAGTYGQLPGGSTRPLLALAAEDSQGAYQLRNLAETLPDSIWAWWAPSMVMVVSLLDSVDEPGTQPDPTSAASIGTPGDPASVGTQLPDATQPLSQPDIGSNPDPEPPTTTLAQNPALPVQATTTATLPTSAGLNSGHAHGTPECNHPGNGHAYGRCRNR